MGVCCLSLEHLFSLWFNFFHQAGGFILAAGILAAGIYLTVKTGFIQLRYFPYVVRRTLLEFSLPRREVNQKSKYKGDLSPFQALTTALAATVGTGNLAGVATALTLGGPGAVFWMWLSAFFGMMLKFSEIVLAVTYRRFHRGGTISGGPMYALSYGLGVPWLGVVFAISGTLAAPGIGNLVQSHTVAHALNASLGISPLATGMMLALVTASVILGGIRRIGVFTSRLIPAMSLLYFVMALIILLTHHQMVPAALLTIFKDAFSGTSAAGGFAGASVYHAFRYGVTRGIFTNEAGLGSASIAHAAARTESPVKQGMWGMIEVFIDTHLLCTVTVLSLLVTGSWTTGLEGISMTIEAFNRGLPWQGGYVVTAGLVLFAFSSLISWSYYGEKCFEFIFPGGDLAYRYFWIILVVPGSLGGLRSVWAWADTMNVFMALTNLVAVLALSSTVSCLVRSYFKSKPPFCK